MPFVDFHTRFPVIAEREVRTLTILPGGDSEIPVGRYGFVDMYCDEPGCDCRRVFFTVAVEGSRNPAAVISWGWEAESFYARWMREADPNVVRHLKGPSLEPPFGPHTSVARHLLEFTDEVLLSDPDYVDRIRRHYKMFRESVEADGNRSDRHSRSSEGFQRDGIAPGSVTAEASASGPALVAKVGRNAPCPCGSGKKYKKCCEGNSRSRPSVDDPSVNREWMVAVSLPPQQLPRPGTIESVSIVPRDLRRRLERNRLETLALLRCQDRASVYTNEADFPRELRELFELDADCAEALWALDQPPGKLSIPMMLRDTEGSLARLPASRSAVLNVLTDRDFAAIESLKDSVVTSIRPAEAYNMVKGRDREAQ